jgi:hypothetical protein
VRTLRLRLSDEMASSPWAGAESVLQVTLNRLTGYRRSPRGRQRRPIIRSTGTLRIRQVDGLNLSTVIVTSPLRTVAIVTRTDFHKISRAAGPKGQVGIAGCVHALTQTRAGNLASGLLRFDPGSFDDPRRALTFVQNKTRELRLCHAHGLGPVLRKSVEHIRRGQGALNVLC